MYRVSKKNDNRSKNFIISGYCKYSSTKFLSSTKGPICHVDANFEPLWYINGHVIQVSAKQPPIFHLFTVIKNEN